MPLQFDLEYSQAAGGLHERLSAAKPPGSHDVQWMRTEQAAVYRQLLSSPTYPPNIRVRKHTATAEDAHKIAIYQFVKDTQDTTIPTSAIIHYHGGGMMMGQVSDFRQAIADKVDQTGVTHFAVEFRCAPEHPAPVPVQDAFAALKWVHEHSSQLKVDPSRIAVMGESGGGGIAACVALLARDGGLSPPLAKQILVYPMLDDRNLNLDKHIAPFTGMWSINDNIAAWTAVLGNKVGSPDVSAYTAAARAQSLGGLPPTYIDCGELDILRDENIEYATRLMRSHVSTELHIYAGVSHAFEVVAPQTKIAQRAMSNRYLAMTSF